MNKKEDRGFEFLVQFVLAFISGACAPKGWGWVIGFGTFLLVDISFELGRIRKVLFKSDKPNDNQKSSEES